MTLLEAIADAQRRTGARREKRQWHLVWQALPEPAKRDWLMARLPDEILCAPVAEIQDYARMCGVALPLPELERTVRA